VVREAMDLAARVIAVDSFETIGPVPARDVAPGKARMA